MEIVLQVSVIVLEASALVWSALAHTVDSNSVEGHPCTLNYKKIPRLVNMAQRAVKRPWIRHRQLKYLYILTFTNHLTRHRTAMIDLKFKYLCETGTSQHT